MDLSERGEETFKMNFPGLALLGLSLRNWKYYLPSGSMSSRKWFVYTQVLLQILNYQGLSSVIHEFPQTDKSEHALGKQRQNQPSCVF